LREQRFEFDRARLGRILPLERGRALKLRDQRMQGAVLMVRRAQK
jgi:hypothetical protein